MDKLHPRRMTNRQQTKSMKPTHLHTTIGQANFPLATWLILATLALISCTGGGRVRPSTEQTDHPTLSAQERWALTDRSLTPGSYAPLVRLPFLFTQEQGAEQRLDSINHTAHILLFWASWCSDCREETPALLALQKDFPELAWLTVSLDNEAAKARDYVWENKLSGMHLFDGRDWRGQACEDYAVALHGIPHMILIDSQGRLTWSGQQTDSLRSAITHLLKAEHSHKAHK